MSARVRISEGEDGRLYVKWWVDDYGRFLRIKENFKERFSRDSGRAFDDATKAWSVPVAEYCRLCTWLDLWFDPDEQEWGEDEPASHRYGGRSYSGGQSSYGRYQQHTSTSTIEAAFATLHLLPTAPPELVQAAHRALTKLHHPDVGGDTQLMTRINLAMQLIREQTEEKAS